LEEQILRTFEEFERLEATMSKLDKETILRRNKDNLVMRNLLYLTYNPFKMYNVKQIPPIQNDSEGSILSNYDDFTELLALLESRAFTGNDAKALIQAVFSHMSPRELKWYTRVLRKDLNVGIQAKTINSCIPSLIPTFSVMLAHQFEERKLPRRFKLQPKLDGMRIIGDTDTGLLFSRKGKIVSGFGELEESVRALPKGLIIDGEIVTGKNFNHLMTQAFRKDADKKAFINAFDLIPREKFYNGFFEMSFWERDDELAELLHNQESPVIVKVDSSPILTDIDESMKYYESFLEQGYEGAMIKDIEAPYECKRSYGWQKLKPVMTFDLEVIGVEEGKEDTKYSDCVGKLVCSYNGNEVRVGSGLSDYQRIIWWDDPTLIVGKIIEIEGQEITDNKRGTHSIRFTRFKRIREDK
jgi:DNA ligase-1